MSKVQTKKELCLMALLKAPYQGLYSLDTRVQGSDEASGLDDAGEFWTSCLRSDVSKLKNNNGIGFVSKVDTFTSKRGYKAPFKRYWIASQHDAIKGIELVNHLRTARGADPLDDSMVEKIIDGFAEPINRKPVQN